MSRLKTFGKYLLMFVAFYIFVTVASIGFIKGTYETMEQNVYSSDEIQIEVDEAKSTFVNGYVKGKLTNNSDSDIHSKYVKINFLSKKGNVILTKYLDIDELKAKETKNFTINFEAENIKSFNMSLVDEYIQEKSNAQLINLSDAENEEIKKYLDEKEIKYKDLGCMEEESVDYPNIAKAVAKEVQNKKAEKGILICRSGLGMSICANKFKGIRCTPCHNEYTARYSRLHNDSNILAMGADDVSTSEAICILRMWLATEFEGGRHEERLRIIEEIENENMK